MVGMQNENFFSCVFFERNRQEESRSIDVCLKRILFYEDCKTKQYFLVNFAQKPNKIRI